MSVIPATIQDDKLDKALETADNIVLMKVYKNFPQVVEKLNRYGLADNAVMISRCGLENEQVVSPLADTGDQKINYLSTILARRNKG